MKEKVRIGVVCLARKTFDYQAALDIYKEKCGELEKDESTDYICIPELVIEVEDAKKAARKLNQEEVDGWICISGTFHLGHLVLEIQKILNVPVLLWGWDELPYNGGKIRLNSVCGVNLNASNLYKSGIRNYQVVIGDEIDQDWIDALRVIHRFKNAHIGILGYRAKGFFNLGVYDLNVYQELGALIDHYELSSVMNTEVKDEEVKRREKQFRDCFDISGISEDQLKKTALLTAKFDQFIQDNQLDSVAVRCWPEFAATFGIAPCAAMSLLQSEHKILSCEGDVEGAFSMMAHQAAGAETPFLFDFSQVNLKENHALLWHCGVAPCNLWDGKSVRSLDSYHMGGKGVTADFVLKDGDLSVLRIDSAGTEVRMFIQKAEVVPMQKDLKGTYMKAVFENPVSEVLQKVVDNGFAHHASVVYGDFIKPFEILAKIKGWRIVR